MESTTRRGATHRQLLPSRSLPRAGQGHSLLRCCYCEAMPKPTSQGSMSNSFFGLITLVATVMLMTWDNFFGLGWLSLKCISKAYDWNEASVRDDQEICQALLSEKTLASHQVVCVVRLYLRDTFPRTREERTRGIFLILLEVGLSSLSNNSQMRISNKQSLFSGASQVNENLSRWKSRSAWCAVELGGRI
jgi:hypothetical protein